MVGISRSASGERCAELRRNEPTERSGEEGHQDAAAEHQERDRRGAEDRELPRLAHGERERDRGTEDGADGGRAGAGQERPRLWVGAELVEVAGTEEYEGERGEESANAARRPPASPAAA